MKEEKRDERQERCAELRRNKEGSKNDRAERRTYDFPLRRAPLILWHQY